MIGIRDASPGDLEPALELLRAASLPVEDLGPAHLRDFLVAIDDASERIAGVAGLELLGSVGLLRSLVVDPAWRSHGVGRQLLAELERRARRRGLNELWLLTIGASRYFEALGFDARPRSEAPPEVRQTREFTDLCPGTAVLMQKCLTGAPGSGSRASR